MKQKAGMFIDVQNVQVTFEKVGNEVRYDKLIDYVREQCEKEDSALWKAVVFVPFDPRDQRRERLINALSFMGYRVKQKPVKRLPDGSIKANMDMEITLEILSAASYLDTIIIVSGDSDFVPLIDTLNRMGKRIWVIGTKKGAVGIELIRSSDRYENMDDIEGVIIPFGPSSGKWEEDFFSVPEGEMGFPDDIGGVEDIGGDISMEDGGISDEMPEE